MSSKKKFGVHGERNFAPPCFLAARSVSSEAKKAQKAQKLASKSIPAPKKAG
jgi:hypothetical protein